MSSGRVLCVDDEPEVLTWLSRALRDDFDVDTATSAEVGLERMGACTYSVVVSDMCLPSMDGAAFLGKVKAAAPDTTRILLTGSPDVGDAIAAVNDGAVYRFLAKPCPLEQLRATIRDAADHHRIVAAERAVVDRTVNGVVRLLEDIATLVSPAVASRGRRIRAIVAHVARALRLPDPWELEVAATLSQLGCIALPGPMVALVLAGQEVGASDRRAFDAHPEEAYRLLHDIPRLAGAAEMIRYHLGRVTSGNPRHALGAMLLRVATELDDQVTRGATLKEALVVMLHQPRLDPAVVRTLETYRPPPERWIVYSLHVARVQVGMVCAEDVLASNGGVVLAEGAELDAETIVRLRRFAEGSGVREPVRVRIRA